MDVNSSDGENLFDNLELIKLVIVSFTFVTFKFDSRMIL